MGIRLVGSCGLATVALTVALGTAACSGGTAIAPTAANSTTHGTGSTGGSASSAATNPTATTTATTSAQRTAGSGTTTGSGAGTGTGSGSGSGSGAGSGAGTSAGTSVPGCGNGDLKISWGYGTQSEPLQAGAVVFKNISDHTCTLQGYPGAALQDGGTTINASRVLNGFRGSLPPLSSPPLVTLAPGGVSYAVLEWRLHTNQACYPTGSGSFEVTAPNTTKTVTLSMGVHVGRAGICSSFETNPVVPGTFGVAVGN